MARSWGDRKRRRIWFTAKVRPRDATWRMISSEAPLADLASSVLAFVGALWLSTAVKGLVDAIERKLWEVQKAKLGQVNL